MKTSVCKTKRRPNWTGLTPGCWLQAVSAVCTFPANLAMKCYEGMSLRNSQAVQGIEVSQPFRVRGQGTMISHLAGQRLLCLGCPERSSAVGSTVWTLKCHRKRGCILLDLLELSQSSSQDCKGPPELFWNAGQTWPFLLSMPRALHALPRAAMLGSGDSAWVDLMRAASRI